MNERNDNSEKPARIDTVSLLNRPGRSYALDYRLLKKGHLQVSPPALCLPEESRERLRAEEKITDTFIATMSGGRVVGDCVVMSPDGEIVSDSAPAYPFSIESHLDMNSVADVYSSLPDPVKVNGRVLVLNYLQPLKRLLKRMINYILLLKLNRDRHQR